MAQTPANNSGFALPAPTTDAASSPTAGSPAPSATPGTEMQPPMGELAGLAGGADTSSRDMLIGGGILLVLFVAIFFAKSGYANSLVAKRVPPNKANAAGWWLFVMLASLATGVVLSAVNAARFMTPLIIGPLALVAIAALVLMVVSGRK